MRFQRFKTRRRFSATPRRSFRRGSGTTETKRQIAQVYETELVVSDLSGAPGFLIQSLAPWANGPPGGFDQSWELKGLIYDVRMYNAAHENAEAGVAGMYNCTLVDEMFTPVGAAIYVDTATPATDAPVTVGVYDPFVITPPMGDPASVDSDDDVFPTRVLKQKTGTIQTGVLSNTASRNETFSIGIANFRWAGVLRQRISVASRQGLYLGVYLDRPSSVPASITEITAIVHYQVKYYYRLRR